MRSLPTFPSPSLSASTLLLVWGGVSSEAFGADAPVAANPVANPHKSPNLILGAGVGYAKHTGKLYDVDVVSGASTSVKGREFSEKGVALNAFADFAAVDLGPGNLGLLGGFTFATPAPYMNFALVPRYRFRFPLKASFLRSVEPWAGLGVSFAFREKIDQDYYLWFTASVGCDVAIGSDRFYAGVGADINKGNPRGVSVTEQGHDYEQHMNNVGVLFRLSYLVF